jgi:hypothetical protein
MKFISILFVTLLLAVSSVNAADLSFTLATKHLVTGEKNTYNEWNPGIIYHHDSKYFAGIFLNSYADVAPIVGKRFV